PASPTATWRRGARSSRCRSTTLSTARCLGFPSWSGCARSCSPPARRGEMRKGQDGIKFVLGDAETHRALSFPLPLVGRGEGWGSLCEARSCITAPPPLPNPPPQGGREHTEFAARLIPPHTNAF